MAIEASQIEMIVQEVIKNIKQYQAGASSQPSSPVLSIGHGVFEKMEDAIHAANEAFQVYKDQQLQERERYIQAIRTITLEHLEDFAKMGVEETGMGNVRDKIIKHKVVAEKTPGVEDFSPTVWTGDQGITMVEYAPYGLIGAMTPSTNPSETIICNSIGMLAAGNVVIFNAHPGAKRVSAYAVQLINKAIVSVGGPMNLVTCVANPTLETGKVLIDHPEVKLLVGTGGPAVVKALLQSGKKAIGAGAGNPPVIVDETANLRKAAKDILNGALLDNNLPCISEKEIIVLDAIADDFIYHLLQNGVYMATKEEVRILEEHILTPAEHLQSGGCSLSSTHKSYGINKRWIGKDVDRFLHLIGHKQTEGIRAICCEVDEDHPFVMEELMMPVLPIVRAKNFEEALRIAVKAEKGNRHSAHIHSQNMERITRFAKIIATTVFVVNGPSYAAIGVEGEGYCTFTLAGPTGEGLTSPRTFTRSRRFVISSGGLHIK